MNGSAKRAARLAILSALAAVLLFLTGVIPAGKLGLMAVASLPVAIALMQYGIWWSIGVYVVVSLLSGLLYFSDAVLGFILFFGYYPAAKSLLEKIHSRVIEYAAKFCLYSVIFWLCEFFASSLFAGFALPAWVLYPVGAAVFFVYDWCYSLAISIYINKLARFIHD